jgi:hypothetical protein
LLKAGQEGLRNEQRVVAELLTGAVRAKLEEEHRTKGLEGLLKYLKPSETLNSRKQAEARCWIEFYSCLKPLSRSSQLLAQELGHLLKFSLLSGKGSRTYSTLKFHLRS